MYTEKLITSKKYFKMAAKSGFPFVFNHPVGRYHATCTRPIIFSWAIIS